MLIEDVEQLQTWLTATLSLISEADPTALAKYVTALVKRDEPAQELKTTCIELLDIFLQRNTERFVEKLFNVLENNSYIVKPVQPLIIRNKKWKRKPRPSTARGRKPQYRKVSPVTVSGNNQQYRKPCPVTVSVNNQQYRKPSPVTVSGNNQQFRRTSPVSVSGNNQLYRKSSPVSVSGNNQQYRKPSPVSVSVNNQQFRRTSPVTVSGNNQQYRKASSVTISGNNQQFRKASPVTVSGNNQQYRKGSTVTVFGNNQQYRKASPVTISGNNQQFRKASPVSVSWNNQQYRKPSPVTVSGNNQQYRKACPVTVSGNNQQFRKPSPVTVSGNNQQYRKVSPVTVSGNNQQYRKPSPSACSSPETKYQNRKPSPYRKVSPVTVSGNNQQYRKPCPVTVSVNNQQYRKPSPVTVSGNNQQFRRTSPVSVSGNNQLYRKSSPVSVSGNNQQYRKPSPVSVSVNNQQFRRTSPVTVSGNNQQYRKASSVTISGNNQQFRKASPVTVSGNNQQYRKGSTVTVFGNNQQYRKASPVTISGNNQQFRKASPVSVSWNNQQYRKPSPVTVSGNNQQYRKACPVTVSGNNQQFRKPSPVTVSGNNQQYRKVSPVTVSGNNQQYRKPSPSACSSPETKYQNRKPSPSTAQEIKCQKRKSSPSTYSSPETKRQNRKPSPLSDSVRNQQQSKYNQVPFVNKKGKYTKVIPENALRPVSPVVSRNRDVNSACDRRIVKLYPDSRIETLQSISSTDMEKPTSDNPYLDTRSKDLGNDWLDYIEMQEMFEHTAVEDVEELLCFRKKGRGCMEPQHVPRLPLKATIQRMMSDDLSASGHSGRGRARLLQNRAKASKPQGLHKKSTERLKADEKREVIRPPFVIRSQIDSIENVYTQQWQQEEFPRLLRAEDTNNGSPKKLNKKALNVAKQTKSEARKHQEDLGEEITSGTDLLTQSFEQEVNHIPEAKKVNTAKAAKKKFDFSKANQELLQEFPIVKNSGPKIFSLTQQNLERFLRESDSESCSSQENSCVSHNANEEIIERMPVYQRYAVTLDDIRKSKSSKVPPKVKGCLADLLEAMDAYCENPETYFDKRNKESDNLNLVPNEKDSVTIETADKKHDTLTFNNDLKISDIELRNAEAVTNPQSNENIDDTLSNVSVVSDISSLNSPSENELEINDDIVKDMNESLESSHVKSNHINQKFDIGKGLNSEIVMGNNEMCNKKEINGTCDVAKLTAGKHQSSIVKGEMFVNELNVKTEKEVRTKSEHSYCLEKAVSIRSLDEIDLKTPPVPKSTDKDMKGFQKVGSKQKKAKLPSDVKKTINGVSNDQTIWRIYGRNAIQVDGLPANCDISELHGMVSGFGTVVDFQVRIINKATSVRFRLHNEDACEYAVQCLDQTDCLFPECNCKLSCHQLQT